MNLISDPWLPFKLIDGSEKTLPISAICETQVVDFALPRADFQGAAYQLAIGLLQTTFAPKNADSWHGLYRQAPDIEVFKQALKKAAHAFNCDGDGPLFMQDLDTLDEVKPTTAAGLLIEAPGANGLKLNTDHFIKRGIGAVMSPEMANIALFTLQTNAPSGGSGHRTGLRGGGPLTTLILPQKEVSTLWQKLWLNVINRDVWRYDEPDLNSESVFPWLANTRTSDKPGTEIFQDSVHPLHMFWAMPRRIRLAYEEGESQCHISGQTVSKSVTTYRTQNYGGNYSGKWEHPLTPYKWDPKKPDQEPLSVKGQPGGVSYKIWDTLTLSNKSEGQQCAKTVEHFYRICDDFDSTVSETPRLWAFAYDMDNMKARGWYSTTLPIFAISPEQQEDVLFHVKGLQKLAADTLWQCRTQIKSAWFDKPGDVKGDLSFIDFEFWHKSEITFYQAVQQIIENCHLGGALSTEQASSWLDSMRRTATDIFDEHALSELGSQRSMRKRIKARQLLTAWLYSKKKSNPIYKFSEEFKLD